jgi:hypothetical protein
MIEQSSRKKGTALDGDRGKKPWRRPELVVLSGGPEVNVLRTCKIGDWQGGSWPDWQMCNIFWWACSQVSPS